MRKTKNNSVRYFVIPVVGYSLSYTDEYTHIPSNLQKTSSCRVYNNMYNDTVAEEMNWVPRSAALLVNAIWWHTEV